MQLTFACPNCGTEYDLPWSMAGKRAHCRRCDYDFVIPAPFEAKSPRSSEAIPVVAGAEPPPVAAPRPARGVEPPPPEVLEALRTGSKPRPIRAEPPRPAPMPPPSSSPSRSGPVPRPVDAEDFFPSPRSKARPPWLIPSIAGGGAAFLVILNVGLYLATVRKPAADRDTPDSSPTTEAAPTSPPPIVEPSPPPPPPEVVASPVVAAKKAVEEVPDRPMSTADIVSSYEPSVALIKGKKGSGTGFLARPGVVATNAHVIDGERAADLEVRFPSAEEGKQGPLPARVLYRDRERDLALLGVATELPPVRVAAKYKFRKGEDVTVIGNPGVGGKLILENAISRGIVSSMARINDRPFLQLGIAINPGNSGGPVFDPKGRVIGVVTLKTVKQEGLAFAIPAEDLLAALDSAVSKPADAAAESADAPADEPAGLRGLSPQPPRPGRPFGPRSTPPFPSDRRRALP